MMMIVMKIKVLFQNINIHLMIIFLLKYNLRYSNSFLNYDEVTQGRTDDNNSTDDNELSYSLKLFLILENIRNTFYIQLYKYRTGYKDIHKCFKELLWI